MYKREEKYPLKEKKQNLKMTIITKILKNVNERAKLVLQNSLSNSVVAKHSSFCLKLHFLTSSGK